VFTPGDEHSPLTTNFTPGLGVKLRMALRIREEGGELLYFLVLTKWICFLLLTMWVCFLFSATWVDGGFINGSAEETYKNGLMWFEGTFI
jgi:hypothetical protein